MENDLVEEFEGSQLGDGRRDRRLTEVVRRLSKEPGRSLPEAMEGDAELEGCYRFLNNESVSAEAILAPHRRRTVQRAAAYPDVLVVHDTTTFRYSAEEESREGLGPLLSKHGARGFFAHVSLVLSPDTESRDPLECLACTRTFASRYTGSNTSPSH